MADQDFKSPGGRDAATSGTVLRVIQVLRHVAYTEGDTTVMAVADSLGLPASTAHRMLRILTSEGLVTRTERGLYTAGAEFRRLAKHVLNDKRVETLARPAMQRLVAETEESCALGIYRPHDRTMSFTAVVECTQPLTYRVPIDRPAPVYLGASGRSILAFAGDDVINTVASKDMTGAAGEPSPTEIHRSLEEIRRDGFAFTVGEKLQGAAGIAAPLLGTDDVLGCLCLTIPESRLDRSKVATFGKLLVDEAAQLSAALGSTAEAH